MGRAQTMPGWVSHRRGSDFIPITVGSQRMALSRRVNPRGLHCETDHSHRCVNNRFKVESRHGERTVHQAVAWPRAAEDERCTRQPRVMFLKVLG